MKLITKIFLLTIILNSCVEKNETKELSKFDKNGKLIVYNEGVYAEMWTKNNNLDVTVIDTLCISQKAKALNDIKNGKLIYFGLIPEKFKSKVIKILSEHGIETKEYFGRCVRMKGFEPYCYQNEMYKAILKKYGDNFIELTFENAKKQFVKDNPNIEYLENGIDLRSKFKKE
jgi:hypothetical protein